MEEGNVNWADWDAEVPYERPAPQAPPTAEQAVARIMKKRKEHREYMRRYRADLKKVEVTG